LKPVAANYSVFVHLYGRDGETMGQFDTYPGLGAWPTTLLSPGDVLADTYPVPLFAEVENAAPARLRVAVGLYEYDRPGFPRPPAVDAGGAPLDATFAGDAKLVPWQWPVPAPAHPLRVQFDDHITLTGYDAACAPPSGPCELTLYWAADGAPSADYQVFIQLWRGEAQVAGFDGPPVNGDYPAGYWAAGETIIDRHAISLPADLPPGEYRFRVGLYRLETGQRLAAAGPAGPLPDFAVDLPLALP
ncbi:MAG: hypothetical protein ACE5G8_07095, partial [Anaerolineae bacterium]